MLRVDFSFLCSSKNRLKEYGDDEQQAPHVFPGAARNPNGVTLRKW